MKQEKSDIFYGALLHDIGKVVQRATGERAKHALVGTDWLKNFTDNATILAHVKNHMASHQDSLPEDHTAYITYIADNIASGVDRRKSCEETEIAGQIWDHYTNQADIFNVFGAEPSQRYFQPVELDVQKKPNLASRENSHFTKGEYSRILQRITEAFRVMDYTPAYHSSFLNLLEATLSYVPSSTNTKEIADISLFEHSKLTAGFALAIYDYLKDQGRTQFSKELFRGATDFYKEEAFLLASFDLSGIQDFIYNIATSGAAKQLKARSFYLDFMGEHLVDSLLDRLELNRANLLYIGGGHAYLLLANTASTRQVLEEFEKEMNAFLLANVQTRLYVAFGWSAFAAQDIMVDSQSAETYRQIYQKVSQQISAKKLRRYNWKTLMVLNRGGKKAGRECVICHAVDSLEEKHGKLLCGLCSGLHDFSKKIQFKHYLVSGHPSSLPVGPDAYLHALDSDGVKNKPEGRVYSKNDFFTGEQQATHIYVGDYQAAEIYDYAQLSTEVTNSRGERSGIKRLAVVRLDVDDLGAAFMAGYSVQGNGSYNTFSRTASFSRSMSQFFKVYINQFASGKAISIIYSGGDDVFAIGTWQDIIAFTIDLRQQFINWTNGKLTLSAGIGLFTDKTPISLMARETGYLEEAAKANDKDSISLFEEEFTFKFDDFIQRVYGEYLTKVRTFFNTMDDYGKSFLYRLIELLRSTDRLDIARAAYYLTRLEEKAKGENKELFKEFKVFFMNVAMSNQAAKKELEMALTLYVYEIRKDS
ncbi:type III-A CRISPR-associated protein Cas10/Csm1 [Streptococcus suis]